MNVAEHPLTLAELETKSREELIDIAKELSITGYTSLNKQELALRLLQAQTEAQGFVFSGGILDIVDEGYGFLRQETLLPGNNDVYVSQSQIRRFNLRTGDMVRGQVRPPKEGEKYHSMIRVEAVNGMDPEVARNRAHFNQLIPIFPNKMLNLETAPNVMATRLINLVSPIGRGQRGLIVSPPKAGKTTILKQIANGITTNYSDIHLMICLIGERPEEVTDMKRSVKAEVVASTFDEPVESHTRVAELALERAKRLAEIGTDVVILLDGITRLTRSYNLSVPSSGRTLSGGIDPVALYPSKRFFGAARNTDGGGSLTILATCLVDTGSRMDDVIYEEFKGTGNLELHLVRSLAEKRIFPAIDILRSGTRREELLLDEKTHKQVMRLRNIINKIAEDVKNPSEVALEVTARIIDALQKTSSNQEFLNNIAKVQ